MCPPDISKFALPRGDLTAASDNHDSLARFDSYALAHVLVGLTGKCVHAARWPRPCSHAWIWTGPLNQPAAAHCRPDLYMFVE